MAGNIAIVVVGFALAFFAGLRMVQPIPPGHAGLRAAAFVLRVLFAFVALMVIVMGAGRFDEVLSATLSWIGVAIILAGAFIGRRMPRRR